MVPGMLKTAKPDRNRPANTPLYALLAVTILAMAAFFLIYRFTTTRFLEKAQRQREAGLEQTVTLARNTIEPIVARVRQGRLSPEQGLVLVRELVRRMVYHDEHGDNYIFMSAYDGTMLVQPFEPQKELTPQWDLQDVRGKYIIRALVQAAQEHPQGSFVSYHYYPPGSDKAEEKLAFVEGIPELGCYIGTGAYQRRHHREQADLLSRASYLSLLLLVLVMVPVLLSLREIIARNRALRVEIEERNLAEARLRESETNLSLLFDHIHDALIVHDYQGRILTVNARACVMYGILPDQAASLTLADLSAQGEGPDDLTQFFKKVREGDNLLFEWRCHRQNGQEFDTEVALAAGFWSGREAVFALVRDIGARKAADNALRLSEEKFQQAFRASPVWVAITTLDEGRFLEVNDTFTTLTGVSAEEAIGSTSLELGFWPDQVQRAQALEQFHREGSLHNFEITMRFRDGKKHRLLWSAEAIDFMGLPCLVNVMLDVTSHRQAEAEKARLEEHLVQSQKMEAVGTLAGGIAHDFNNILGGIIGYAELAQKQTRLRLDNQHELDMVLGAAERARLLVRQILTFSRRLEPESKPLGLNRAVEQAAALLGRTLPKMISIQLDLDPSLALINADPVQMEQVIINLATNAADAMPEGGVLTITTANRHLDRGHDLTHLELNPGDYVVLQVRDTGLGMEYATREKIFEPFFTTKEVGKGTGLGLATVYGIVRQHDGQIVCDSTLGRGTTFRVFLPALPPGEEATTAQETALEEVLSGQETILLVDDEEDLRELGARTLSGMGYRVLTAASGEQALEVFARRGPEIDLVILDLSMPGMGGHKCLLRLLETDPKTKVVIASGYAATGLVQKSLAAGARAFVPKPFRLADMLSVVRRVLDA